MTATRKVSIWETVGNHDNEDIVICTSDLCEMVIDTYVERWVWLIMHIFRDGSVMHIAPLL